MAAMFPKQANSSNKGDHAAIMALSLYFVKYYLNHGFNPAAKNSNALVEIAPPRATYS
jgi:hypothetical protein